MVNRENSHEKFQGPRKIAAGRYPITNITRWLITTGSTDIKFGSLSKDQTAWLTLFGTVPLD